MEEQKNDGAKNKSRFLLGAVTGILMGAAAALLLAPKSGKQLREDITDKYQKVSDSAQELAKQTMDKSVQWTHDVSDKAVELAHEVTGKTTGLLQEISSKPVVFFAREKQETVTDGDKKAPVEGSQEADPGEVSHTDMPKLP